MLKKYDDWEISSQAPNQKRKCKKCGVGKTLDQFHLHSGGKPRGECKECRSEYTTEWYRKNREKQLAKARAKYAQDPSMHWTPERRQRANHLSVERNRELREEVISHYGAECVACGECEPLFLTLDHVNNDGAKMRKDGHGPSSSGVYRWIKKNGYPDIFQILCMNCNFGKARNGGVLVRDRRLAEGSTAIPEGSRAKRPEARSPLKCESI